MVARFPAPQLQLPTRKRPVFVLASLTSPSSDAVGPGTFMRFETGGVAQEHRWSNELQKSPFAKVVFRETTGANRRLQPTWLQRRLSGMRRPTSNLGPTSPSYPVVRMRLQLEEGWGAGGKRMKAVFNLESGNGTLNDRLYKRTGAFIISTWSDESPNIQAQEDEDCLLRVQQGAPAQDWVGHVVGYAVARSAHGLRLWRM